MRPDDHDIVTRHKWGYDNSTIHEAVCRCGWKVWEDTELAATLAWMLHNVDVIAVEAARQASRSRHPSGSDGIGGPW